MAQSRKEFIITSLLATAGLSRGFSIADENYKVNQQKRKKSTNSKGINISVFSKHLQWLDYKQMANAASNMGFDGIDLTVRPGGHVLPENVREDLPKAVEATRSVGLQVFTISTAITDPQGQFTEAILSTASQLGIKHYRTGWLNYDKGQSISKNLKSFKQKLEKLGKLNKKYGIYGDYQNHSGTGLGAPVWDIWIILHEINSPWVGSQYDIRHAIVEGANSWPLGLKAIHPHIGTIDIKDFHWEKTGNKWIAKNVPLGRGMIDFDEYFRFLEEYKIKVPITIHSEYDLGGAEHGNSTITITGEKVLRALKSDLETLRKFLQNAGLK